METGQRIVLGSVDDEIPFIGAAIEGTIIDNIANLVIKQQYVNLSDSPLECVFKWCLPYDFNGSLTGFTAHNSDGHTLVGKIEESSKAQDLYDDTIASGNTAMLMSSSDSKDEYKWFEIDIGSLKSHKSVLISIEIVMELKNEKNISELLIPCQIFCQQIDIQQLKQSLSKINSNRENLLIGLHINLTIQNSNYKIKKIDSCNHVVGINNLDNGDTNIKIRLQEFSSQDFKLRIETLREKEPLVVIEDLVIDGRHDYAAYISFFPNFLDNEINGSLYEIIFVVDRSGSMEGNKMSGTKAMLELFVRSLPSDCFFNIVSFGSTHKSLFNQSVLYDQDTLKEALETIKYMEADMCGTNLLDPLTSIFKEVSKSSKQVRIFILTDGQVEDRTDTLKCVKENQLNNVRIFSFGLGKGADMKLVSEIAKSFNGQSEFISEDEPIEDKVMIQLTRALQYQFSIDSISFDGNNSLIIPGNFPPVFQGERMNFTVIFEKDVLPQGYVKLCGKYNGQDISLPIEISSKFRILQSKLVHSLAARSMINHLETDLEKNRDKIIEISKKFSVLSKITSFILVDKDNRNQSIENSMKLWVGPRPNKIKISNKLRKHSLNRYYNKLGFLDDSRRKREEQSIELRKDLQRKKDLLNQLRVQSRYQYLEKREPIVYRECLYKVVQEDDIFSNNNEKPVGLIAARRMGLLRDSSEKIEKEEISQKSKSFQDFIGHQNANGSWSLKGISIFLEVDSEQLLNDMPNNLKLIQNNQLVWASILASAILEIYFSNNKNNWNLMNVKTVGWIKKQVDDNFDELYKEAVVIVQKYKVK